MRDENELERQESQKFFSKLLPCKDIRALTFSLAASDQTFTETGNLIGRPGSRRVRELVAYVAPRLRPRGHVMSPVRRAALDSGQRKMLRAMGRRILRHPCEAIRLQHQQPSQRLTDPRATRRPPVRDNGRSGPRWRATASVIRAPPQRRAPIFGSARPSATPARSRRLWWRWWSGPAALSAHDHKR